MDQKLTLRSLHSEVEAVFTEEQPSVEEASEAESVRQPQVNTAPLDQLSAQIDPNVDLLCSASGWSFHCLGADIDRLKFSAQPSALPQLSGTYIMPESAPSITDRKIKNAKMVCISQHPPIYVACHHRPALVNWLKAHGIEPAPSPIVLVQKSTELSAELFLAMLHHAEVQSVTIFKFGQKTSLDHAYWLQLISMV